MRTQAAPVRESLPHIRWRHRLRRLWRALRWVPIATLVAAISGGIALAWLPAGRALLARGEAGVLSASAALGLVVGNVEVEGRTTTSAATILSALGARRGTPILAVDPDRARQRLERLPWVSSATIERRLPATLFVRLVERRPLAVWQHDGQQQLIDDRGEVIPVKGLSAFVRLPTVVGADAARHAAELLAMLAQQPVLAARVTAAVRVDNRRWDVRIDHRIDVLLPEKNPAAAWTKLAELERTTQLLQRDVEAVDLRLSDRLVLRVSAPFGKNAAPERTTAQAGGRQ
jgi:cell division protein FtsQ